MRRNLYLPDEHYRWAAATGNASGYIQDLIERRQAEYVHARFVLDRFSHPQIMAVMDVLNGHIFTQGMSPASEIRANLDDAAEMEGLREKWKVADGPWTELLTMTDEEGRAFKVVAEEFWGGRSLD